MLWEIGYSGERTGFDWGRGMTNRERIDTFVNVVAPTYTEAYISQTPERYKIFERYGVETTGLFCSDPRVGPNNFGVIEGIVQPKRSIGGRFDPSDRLFRAHLARLIDATKRRKNDHLVINTAHYSAGEEKRCCAGFGYNTAEATRYAIDLSNKLRRMLKGISWAYTALCAIETDRGGVTFFGHDGSQVSSADYSDSTSGEIYYKISQMYKDFPERMKLFIFNELLKGNYHNVLNGDHSEIPVLLEHHECFLAYGQGFYPLPRGRVLILNPYTSDMRKTILEGLGIIEHTLKAEDQRVKNGFVFAVGSVFDSSGEKDWAIGEVLRETEDIENIVKAERPDLFSIIEFLPMVTFRETREVIIIER